MGKNDTADPEGLNQSYLMHGPKHLSRVGYSFHGAGKDVQGQFQPLQDSAALNVYAQALQCLKTHTHTQSVTRVLIEERLQVALKLLHLQRLPASAQLQLDVLLSQVPGVFLRLKPLLQGVLVTMEGHGDLRKGPLPAKQLIFHLFYDQIRLLWEP